MARLNRRSNASLYPEWIALAAGLLALGTVHIAEYEGLVPCALCLVERWPYRVAVVLAVLGLAWPRARKVVAPLLVAVFVAALAIAVVHVGVEAGWWKSPLPECAAPILRTGSIADLLASMPTHPSKPCDDPTYLIPGLGVSMAQMNAIFALATGGLIATCIPWRGLWRKAGR